MVCSAYAIMVMDVSASVQCHISVTVCLFSMVCSAYAEMVMDVSASVQCHISVTVCLFSMVCSAYANGAHRRGNGCVCLVWFVLHTLMVHTVVKMDAACAFLWF